MITLHLNNYTEDEKQLLVQCITAACREIARKRIAPQECPALSRDLVCALRYARCAHHEEMVSRTLGKRVHSPYQAPLDPFFEFEVVVHQDHRPPRAALDLITRKEWGK